jgi:hypothetical protein
MQKIVNSFGIVVFLHYFCAVEIAETLERK